MSGEPMLLATNHSFCEVPVITEEARLGRLVAEKVMGWRMIRDDAGHVVQGTNARLTPDSGEDGADRAFNAWLAENFRPFERIADAWQVHRRMDEMPNAVLSAYLAELDRILFARWRQRTGARVARAEDMPGYIMELDGESICRAALKAVETHGSLAAEPPNTGDGANNKSQS